ncbi:glycosyltransferase [Verrucomicrobiales bacterium]|nr:glycosyltransferase [Verrucomicrobiales bacterium]
MTASIVIVTRNRRDQALIAVRSALAQATEVEVLLYDDASDDDTADACDAVGDSRLKVIRGSRQQGYITLRNQGFKDALAPYVFSLDDDAWFSSIDAVEKTVTVFEADDTVGAVALAFVEPDRQQPAGNREQVEGEQLASYRGCAHAVRRDLALGLGGYRECLIHQGEERDLCIRILAAGSTVTYCQCSPVVHLYSPAARQWSRSKYYGARNMFLFEWWHTPLRYLPIRLAVTLINVMRYKVKLREIPNRIMACLSGLVGGVTHWRFREPLSVNAYKCYRTLPGHAPLALALESELRDRFPPVE